MNFKALILLVMLPFLACSCKDEETISATPHKKITLNLPDTLVSETFAYSIPIHRTDKYKDVDWSNVAAYMGNWHPNNKIAQAILEGDTLSFYLPHRLSTADIFVPYKNLDYNNLECKPENLARSISKVRFFSTKNHKEQYEIILGLPIVNNPDMFKREYDVYFWDSKGTVTGSESLYKCDFVTKPGWNITERVEKQMAIVKNFAPETRFCVKHTAKAEF